MNGIFSEFTISAPIHYFFLNNAYYTMTKSALLICALIISSLAEAQTYAGISVNLGNRLSYAPSATGFERPVSISGSVELRVQEDLGEHWALQYGFGLGVLAYMLKIVTPDTLLGPEPYPFGEASTFYGNFHLSAGRSFRVKQKEMMLGVGGGVSYFYSFIPQTNYGISVLYPDNHLEKLFSGVIISPVNELLFYFQASAQLKLNHRFTIGLEYRQHFDSVLEGEYEFYHTRQPVAGTISLYPTALSVIFLVRISKPNRRVEKG
jgi:hypothetical protein